MSMALFPFGRCRTDGPRQGCTQQCQDLHFFGASGHRESPSQTLLIWQNTAEIFAASLLGVAGGSSTQSSTSITGNRNPEPCPLISHLIQRRDLLDDNNAGKEKMTEAKKKLKILLRPGESEKRPDLAWPKSFKKEPVEVVAVRLGLDLP
jgi:hypothetical protein